MLGDPLTGVPAGVVTMVTERTIEKSVHCHTTNTYYTENSLPKYTQLLRINHVAVSTTGMMHLLPLNVSTDEGMTRGDNFHAVWIQYITGYKLFLM